MTLEDILRRKEEGKAAVVKYMAHRAKPFAPTLEEIAAETKLTPSSVSRYVNELVTEGYLTREAGVYRSIALTDYGRGHAYEPKAVQIPAMA